MSQFSPHLILAPGPGRVFAALLDRTAGAPPPAQRIFSAAKKDDELEIVIYDAIGESFWGGGISAEQVKAKLTEAGDVQKITVRINSPGGDVFEAAAIYSLLTQHKAKVTCYVDSLAASAAFTVAMAGDTIHISESAMMMCHNAWGMCSGDANEMRGMAALLEKVSGTMCGLYASRSGMKPEECQALMDAETWMTAQEAVEYGFADDVVQRSPDDDAKARALAASYDLSRFRRAPRGEATTKSVDGEDLAITAFAYRGDPDKTAEWKLPIEFSSDEKTKTHIRNAIAQWSKTDMPTPGEKTKARARIQAAAKAHDIALDDDSLKDEAAPPKADEGCQCQCGECLDGKHGLCSNPECDDPSCEHDNDNHDEMATADALLRAQVSVAIL